MIKDDGVNPPNDICDTLAKLQRWAGPGSSAPLQAHRARLVPTRRTSTYRPDSDDAAAREEYRRDDGGRPIALVKSVGRRASPSPDYSFRSRVSDVRRAYDPSSAYLGSLPPKDLMDRARAKVGLRHAPNPV